MWAVLIFFTVFMIVYNSVIAFGEPYLPEFVLELFRYGKTLNGPAKTTFVKMISVPKSYFTHFYIFSSIYVPASLATVLYCYINGKVLFHLNFWVCLITVLFHSRFPMYFVKRWTSCALQTERRPPPPPAWCSCWHSSPSRCSGVSTSAWS